MSTIPTSVTEEQFDEHIRPHLNTAKRGYESQIPLYKIFTYILYRIHTDCQWDQCQETLTQKKRIQLGLMLDRVEE